MSNSITFQLHPTLKLNTDDTFPGTEVAHCEDHGSLETLKLDHRMRTLDITGDLEYIKQVTSGSHGTAPNLQSLEIKGDESILESSSHHFDSSFNFLGNSAPSLQKLTFLSVLPLKLFTFPTPKLTTIKWIAPFATVNFEELLDFLAATPLLEDIEIDVKITPLNDPNTLKKKVTLDELLSLSWIDRGGSTSLIPHLVASKLRHLRISVTPPDEKDTALASILTPDNSNDIGLFQIEPVEICCRYISTHSDVLPPELFYQFLYPNIEHDSLRLEIHWDFKTDCPLPDLPISLSSIERISVKTDVEEPPLGSIPFKQLTNLKMLMLEGKIDSLIPLLEPNSSDGSVPYPYLEGAGIDLEKSGSISCTASILKDALRKRNEKGHRVSTLSIAPPCGDEGQDCLNGVIAEVDSCSILHLGLRSD